jgi:hypothetical protein
VDDTDDDDDEGNAGEAGESNGGSSSSRGGRGGTETTGGTENGGSSAGGNESGGSSSGGGPPAGGSSTGGSSTGGSGPGEGAVMKYCNELYKNGEPALLTLLFAGVRATAMSGTCTPVVPNACIAIPTGSNPTVALLDGTTEVTSGTIPDFIVAEGDELLVLASDDETGTMPTVYAGTFAEIYGSEYSCADTDPFTTPPPAMLETKSAPFSLPFERNLRSELRPAADGWAKKRTAFQAQ